MTNHGDDCYFFYYSTCSKGDSCPFRHCEAAMGNETVCNLWQEGRCFRAVCKFRHMEITKNRKEIPCYWENQPAGCQKPHCAFFHEKPRYVDGIFVPPDRSMSKNDEQPYEEPALSPAAPLPTTSNPQLRGVIKTETQEPVPSPTHPPVVINPADDDEDEDDQLSEGEDGKVSTSPRKLPKSDGSLNFGVSTLEEIRLRKALKASMKRAGYPIQSADTSANGEKENIQSLFRPTVYEAREGPLVFKETGRPRSNVVERLGNKVPNIDGKSEGLPLKRSLAERLGRVMGEEEPAVIPQKMLKPIKQRLGLPAGGVIPTQPAETNMVSKNAPEQIRIKTLEEIKQEKAAKSQRQNEGSSVVSPEITKTITTKATKGIKRAITVSEDSVGCAKMFSEVLQTKKKKQEEQNSSPKKVKSTVEKALEKTRGESKTVGLGSEATNVAEVRVKTLEEIRSEKAARIQAQQALEAENKSSDAKENGVKKPRLLRINKLPSQTGNDTTEKSPEGTEKPIKTHTAPPETSSASSNVKVKTFEEIMREKRLRKQEMVDQARTSPEASQKWTPDATLKRRAPVEVSLTSPNSSSPSSNCLTPDTASSTQKLPVPKLNPLKTRGVSSPKSSITPGVTTAAVTAVTSVPVKQDEAESHSQSPSSSREVPDKKTRNSSLLSPTKHVEASPTGPTEKATTIDTTLNNDQKTSPESTAESKVRPKLNVKPSVVKPAVQVKPGQKRKGIERSAVAEVKPLSSTSTMHEEPLQETQCRDTQGFPSPSAEPQLSSAVPRSPSTLLDSGSSSSPLREELQTVPVFKQSLCQETKPAVSVAAPREACTVPQSPILKTPTQAPKTRRQSTSVSRTSSAFGATASSSAVDDFEELISEFTDDHLEEDVDPGIGEDDLLQELSEMIDS